VVDILRVTAAIPCYNGERFIGKALEAILSQTRQVDEILVIDDGSTDNSALVASQCPRVRLIQHDCNKGLAQARNTALSNAVGDVIVYVDADACAEPNMVASLLREYLDEEIVGVGGQGIETSVHTVWDRWRKLYASQSLGDERCGATWLYGICSSYRKRALLDIGGFDPLFRTNAEDVEIGLRLTKAGYRLVYTPHARAYHWREDTLRSLVKQQHSWTYWGALALLRQSPPPIYKSLGRTHLRDTLLLVGGMTLKRSIRDLGRGDARIGLVHWLIWAARVRAVIKALGDAPQFIAQ
jgi:glycosyltransferase involved in cell wall biosynthesis